MRTRKMELHISYNGRNFYGFYASYGLRTVQAVLEEVLGSVLKEKIRITAPDGLSPGASVRVMPVLFTTAGDVDGEELVKQCNARLRSDIRVCAAREVDESYRFVRERMIEDYEYRFLNISELVARDENGLQVVHEPLNQEAMQMAAEYLIGEYDFTSFTTEVCGDPFRTIYNSAVTKQDDIVTIRFSGNGFLPDMVQMLTGELIRIGREELKPDDILERLRLREPDKEAPEMSAAGLMLRRVCPATIYEDVIHNNNDFADYYIVRSSLKKNGTAYVIVMRCEDGRFPALVEHAVRLSYLYGAKKVLAIDGESERLRAGEPCGEYTPRVVKGVNVAAEIMEFRLYGTWYEMERRGGQNTAQ